jgi:CheY-like chemotaxis protein
MKNNINKFAESAKGFTKSPLGIIALFIVLIYSFASLVLIFGKNLENNDVSILIWFLILFPVIVFLGFLWLVVKHPEKIYGPSDFKDEENFIKMQMSTAVSLATATAMQSNPEISQEHLEKIPELVSRINLKKKENNLKNKILWVDDRPINNIYERKAFESQGITFDIALNTSEALELLKINNNDYVAIISDMARKEGDDEGCVLLDTIRKDGIKIPFFIYTGSSAPGYKQMIAKKDGQGTTNRPDELYKMVMDKII